MTTVGTKDAKENKGQQGDERVFVLSGKWLLLVFTIGQLICFVVSFAALALAIWAVKDDSCPASCGEDPPERNYPSGLEKTTTTVPPRRPDPPTVLTDNEVVWDFEVDLSTGGTEGYINWKSPLTRGHNCDRQGVIKIDLTNAEGKILEIQAVFSRNRRGYLLNLGDSPTNNAHAGDGATNFYDAELWMKDNVAQLEASDVTAQKKVWTNSSLFSSGQQLTTLLFTARHHGFSVNNYKDYSYSLLHDDRLFVLDGRYDPEGSSNYDLYLGMNRVIAGSYRSGSGLCYIKGRIL